MRRGPESLRCCRSRSKPEGGRPRTNDRNVIEGILWIQRGGGICGTANQRTRRAGADWASRERAELWLTLWRSFLLTSTKSV